MEISLTVGIKIDYPKVIGVRQNIGVCTRFLLREMILNVKRKINENNSIMWQPILYHHTAFIPSNPEL